MLFALFRITNCKIFFLRRCKNGIAADIIANSLRTVITYRNSSLGMDVNQANMKSSSNYSAGGSTSISRSELRRMAEKIFSNPNLFRNLLRTYPELVNNIYMRESMVCCC